MFLRGFLIGFAFATDDIFKIVLAGIKVWVCFRNIPYFFRCVLELSKDGFIALNGGLGERGRAKGNGCHDKGLEYSLQWRHNGRAGISNHQPNDCLLNRYSGMNKKNIKAPRHWPLCGEFTGTGEFAAQRASNPENVSIWRRHHVPLFCPFVITLSLSMRPCVICIIEILVNAFVPIWYPDGVIRSCEFFQVYNLRNSMLNCNLHCHIWQ